MARCLAVVMALLGFTAGAQSPNGIRSTGLELLSEARAAAEQAPLDSRLYSLDVVAVVQFLAGDAATSIATTKDAIAAYRAQVNALKPRPLGSASPAPFAPSAALRCAQNALSQAYRHHLVKDAAGTRAWVAVARTWLPQMSSDRERASILPLLFRFQLGTADRVGADRTLAIALAMPPDAHVDMAEIAGALAAAGEVDKAKALAVGRAADTQQIQCKVASAQAAAGDFAGARQTLQSLDGYQRQQALAALAEAEMQAGARDAGTSDFAAALATPPPGPSRDVTIALAEGRAGLLQQALTLLTQVKLTPPWTTITLAGDLETLGREAARKKQPDIARRCFAAVRTLFQGDVGEDHRFLETQLEQLAGDQAQSGDTAGAFQTAATLDGPFLRSALEYIAEAQAGAGDLAGARKTLARLAPAPPDLGSREAIALAEARRGNFRDGLTLARVDAVGTEALFDAYCTPNRTSACIAMARALPTPQARSGALLGTAEPLLGIKRPIGEMVWAIAQRDGAGSPQRKGNHFAVSLGYTFGRR